MLHEDSGCSVVVSRVQATRRASPSFSIPVDTLSASRSPIVVLPFEAACTFVFDQVWATIPLVVAEVVKLQMNGGVAVRFLFD